MTEAPVENFTLSWRPGSPVLHYALSGYWTLDDARSWQAAFIAAIQRRPVEARDWYMLGDLKQMKTQSDNVNAVRDAVTQFALANGLQGCVMFGVTGVSMLQLRRLLSGSGNVDRFAYADTAQGAETALTRLRGLQAADPRTGTAN